MARQPRVTFMLIPEIFEYDNEEFYLKKMECDSSTIEKEDTNGDKREIVSISKGLNLIEMNLEIEFSKITSVEHDKEEIVEEVKNVKDLKVEDIKEIVEEVKQVKDLKVEDNAKEISEEVKQVKDLELKDDKEEIVEEVKNVKELIVEDDEEEIVEEKKQVKDLEVKYGEGEIVEEVKSRSTSFLCQTKRSNCSLKLPVERSFDYIESKKFFEKICNSANEKSHLKKIWKYNEVLMSWEKQ